MGDAVDKIFDPNNKPTDTPADPAGFIAEDPQGSYLLLGIDNFDPAASMSSYLRLGAAAPGSGKGNVLPKSTGDDLASMVQGFTDDTRDRSGGDGGPPGNVAPKQTTPDGGPLDTKEQRRSESIKLHTKGGWRDHSDGNRISTTRGDKVEVVRGNYKLLVMGRSDSWDNAAGMDISGGNADMSGNDLAYGNAQDNIPPTGPDASRSIALETSFTWRPQTDGRWGWDQTNIIGSETDTEGDELNHPGNGRIFNSTWVDVLSETVGTSKKRVSSISEDIYAENMTSTTDVSGTNASNFQGEVIDTITVVGANLNMTVAGGQLIAQLIGASVEVDAGGMFAQLQMAGLIPTIQIAPIVFDDVVGLHVDNHEGAHSENTLGLHTEIHTGAHNELHSILHTDTHTLVHLDQHNGAHIDMHVGPHLSYDTDQVDVKKESLEMHGGPVFAIKNAQGVYVAKGTITADQATYIQMANQHIHL
jgi:hypothetical protein